MNLMEFTKILNSEGCDSQKVQAALEEAKSNAETYSLCVTACNLKRHLERFDKEKDEYNKLPLWKRLFKRKPN